MQTGAVTKKVNKFQVRVGFTCHLCKSNDHLLWKCPRFCQMTVPERTATVDKLKLCISCFAHSHAVAECRSTFKCMKCRKRHHTLPHSKLNDATQLPVYPDAMPSTSSQPADPSSLIQSTLGSDRVQSCFAATTKSVFLGTAIVNVRHLGMVFS